ncbi:MAG: carboxypeptidase regulatory-like domain-containing protein, partial [Gemmatimonadales bacterium]
PRSGREVFELNPSSNLVRLDADRIGGRVEFEHLPTGPWIVRRWWIRMPVVGTRQRGLSNFMRESYIKTIEEDGGWVSEVRTLNGEVIERAGVATLTGSVWNLRTAAPLPRARIVLVGTGYETYTDQRGEFRFDDMPDGTYRISYGDEILDALGYVPPLVEVTVALDEPQAVTMVIPSVQQLWSDLCPSSDPGRGGIIAGFIRDSVSMDPIAGVQVLAYRERGALSATAETITNWAGYFRMCDLPGGQAWTLDVRRADEFGVTVRSTEVTLAVGDILRADVAIPSRTP